jgi:hypothetical protein
MSQSSFLISYPYKPKKLIMVICFVFFGLGTWIFAEVVQTNDRELNLVLVRHVMEFSFSPTQATLFYWGLSACSAVMSLLGLFSLYRALTSKSRMVLTKEKIIVPLGLLKHNKTLTISFKEICSLKFCKAHHQRFLTIVHDKGKIQLSESMRPKKVTLDEILNILMSRTGVSQ